MNLYTSLGAERKTLENPLKLKQNDNSFDKLKEIYLNH